MVGGPISTKCRVRAARKIASSLRNREANRKNALVPQQHLREHCVSVTETRQHGPNHKNRPANCRHCLWPGLFLRLRETKGSPDVTAPNETSEKPIEVAQEFSW